MEIESIKKIYHAYSGVYDLLFKAFFHPRQKRALSEITFKPGDKILDVGVGTGLTLPLYPTFCQVVGIDLSASMLAQAQKKVEKIGLTNVTLIEMDACDLDFPDDTFDYVVATHIISVVPEPIRVIKEMKRVAKPNGKFVIVNHFVSNKPWMAKVENVLDPVFRKFGWRTDMSLDDLVSTADLQVDRTFKHTKLDFWQIVHANNNKRPC